MSKPVCTKGGGQVMGFPDPCMTVVGPATAPIPYMNVAQGTDGEASEKVTADGSGVMCKGKKILISSGNEAGNAPGGTICGKIKGKAELMEGDDKVKVEGKAVACHGDTVGANGASVNNVPGAKWAVPSQTKVLILMGLQKKKVNPILHDLKPYIDCSPTLQKQVKKLAKEGWCVGIAPPKKPSNCDYSFKTIWIESSFIGDMGKMAMALAHEAGHFATRDPEIYHKDIDQMDYRTQNRDSAMKSEGEAAYNNFQVAKEVKEKCGLELEVGTPPPLTAEVLKPIFDNKELTKDEKVAAMAQKWGETSYGPRYLKMFSDRWVQNIKPKIDKFGAANVEKAFKKIGGKYFDI